MTSNKRDPDPATARLDVNLDTLQASASIFHLFVNVHPRADFTQVATPDGVQSEYWDRFEHAFATEANDFLESVAEDKPVPVGLELGLKGMEIGWALQKALWKGRSVSFDRQDRRVEEGGQATGV